MTQIERYRLESSLGYRGLARLAELDHAQVWRYCKGKRVPDYASLKALSLVFTIKLGKLITVDDLYEPIKKEVEA